MSVKKMVFLSLLLALSVAIGIGESYIPSFVIPGLKPGLSNVIIILVLSFFSWKEALLISVCRVFMVSALRGTLFQMGFSMSLVGAMLSLLVMCLLMKIFKEKIHLITVSIYGAIFHDIGQILIGILYLGSIGVLYYLPLMAVFSLLTGSLIAVISSLILRNESLTKYVNVLKSSI